MNIINRLKNRIQNEGILKTIKYTLYVSCYCVRECLLNIMKDLRYSRRLLKGNVKTSYKKYGANDVYHTKYSVLSIIFQLIRITSNDVLVDVGCGKGRVINYWLSKKYKNKIIGLELDRKIAAQTKKQFSKWKNVSIIPGNAILNLPKDGTIFYFYNPFSRDIVVQFEKTLSDMFAGKAIKIIYYNPKSINVFQNGKWNIKYINFEKDLNCKRWGRINKYHDLAIITLKNTEHDQTYALINEGYLFIKNRAKQYESDILVSHLMGEEVICMTGEEAAKIFYDSNLFMRNGAAPKRIQKTLFGENAIQSMDGEQHLHRKELFLSLMTKQRQKEIAELVTSQLEASVGKWKTQKKVILFDEVKLILCQVACKWAGVPLLESEIKERADDFSAMIDGFGGVGPRYMKGKSARNRTEQWIEEMITAVRAGQLKAEAGSPLHSMSFHVQLNGNQMSAHMAAIELINVIRPIVAISTYITFAALALYQFPEWKQKLVEGNSKDLENFAQEVRRFYPFGPFLGARVKKNFSWNGYNFKLGMLVLLDMYGTNHDPRVWNEPDKFNPDRFNDQKDHKYDFIPQGGGDPSKTHCCPGEGIVVEVLKASIDFLSNKISYDVPDQDLSYPLNRIPTLPESGFVLSQIDFK